METWLTYLAALLMAFATAFAFPSSQTVLNAVSCASRTLTGVAVFLFIPVSFMTLSAGTASLRKDRIGRKTVTTAVIWTLVSSVVLSLLALVAVNILHVSFPVTASAGGDAVTLFNDYASSSDITGVVSFMNTAFIPMLLLSLIAGMALTPSSDIIRPAYTVFNSLSEAMYRIEKCVTFFGAFYVYLAGTSLFITMWQEKTAFVSPSFFLKTAGASLAVLLVVIPLLYAVFTRFRKNPYRILSRGFSSLVFAFVSGNIYACALQNEAVNRYSLGVQKRIVSTLTPFGILITRGGTCFVSTFTVIALLKTLGAEISTFAAVAMALVVVLLSLLSTLSAGSETALVIIVLLRVLNINMYGAEAAVISIIPFLNGIAAMIDITLISMASNIAALRTKTDVTIPLRDAI